MSELRIIAECVNYFIFDNDYESNELYNLIETDPNKQFFKMFMDLKSNIYSKVKNHNYEILSLGYNCLPHSLSIRSGMKYPKWISKKNRKFFDLGITTVQDAVALLSNRSYLSVDICDRINEKNEFMSRRFHCYFNHDYSNPKLSAEQNICEFNVLLRSRLDSFVESLIKGNCICVLNLNPNENYNNIHDVFKLEEIIKDYNETNHLFIIDTSGRALSYCKNRDNYVHTPLPFKDYVWHYPLHFLTIPGYHFNRIISERISSFIVSKTPLATQKKYDLTQLNRLCVKSELFNNYLDIFRNEKQCNKFIPRPLINLARNSDVNISSSSVFSSETDLRDIILGEHDREYSFHTNKEKNPWIEFDLKHIFTIHKIVIFNRKKHCKNRAYHLCVQTSIDGKNYDLIHMGYLVFDDFIEFQLGGTIFARYVKVSLSDTNYLHLYKVEIY